jgi:hypothetical protein
MAENVAAACAFGWHAVQYTTFDGLMAEFAVRGIRV